MKITWLQKVSNDRLDSVWYGGDIVRIDYKQYTLYISAIGDIKARIKQDYYCDKNNGGCFKDYLEENGINNDSELKQAIKNKEIEWIDNNWFELVIYDNETGTCINEYRDNVIDLEPNEDFSWVKETIEELE